MRIIARTLEGARTKVGTGPSTASLGSMRGHRSIEDDCNGVLDVAWEEDATAWATNAGEVAAHHPLRTLSWLRMLAYNESGWLKRVRSRARPTRSALRDALRPALLPLPGATEMELNRLPLGGGVCRAPRPSASATPSKHFTNSQFLWPGEGGSSPDRCPSSR
jgi:hypothetical protein